MIFTDGVDYRSDVYRFGQNIRALQESGVIVYPIRYDTRAETEQLARRQAGGAVDLGTIINGGAAALQSSNELITKAAQSLTDYQRLTAEGKLGEAGQKLDELKRHLGELQRRQK